MCSTSISALTKWYAFCISLFFLNMKVLGVGNFLYDVFRTHNQLAVSKAFLPPRRSSYILSLCELKSNRSSTPADENISPLTLLVFHKLREAFFRCLVRPFNNCIPLRVKQTLLKFIQCLESDKVHGKFQTWVRSFFTGGWQGSHILWATFLLRCGQHFVFLGLASLPPRAIC